MLGALRRVGDKFLLIVRSRIPENFRDIPRTITIVDDQAISVSCEFAVGPQQCFRRWALKVSTRLRVYRCAEKIVGGGIPDIELDGGIEFDEIYQIRCAESSRLQ